MDLLKKINTKAKVETNTGFGTNPSNYGGRFINKDGTANISKRGSNFMSRISWYHTMLNMPVWKFLFVILSFYAFVNFIFALLYYTIGIQYLDGIENTGSEWIKFWKAYFLVRRLLPQLVMGILVRMVFLPAHSPQPKRLSDFEFCHRDGIILWKV